ncbi:hypothetical protein [Streptomyces sp. NPDC018693]|uniref:hypothetical protein n=1 Tax=unclassified Streptomyces TaxID=2593676 RepID=UPI003792FA4D
MRQRTGRGRHGPWHGGRSPGARPVERSAGAARGPRRSGVVLTAACGAALVLGAAAPVWAAPGASEERDVQLVYCLGPAHRDDLVAAAVRLGLLRPGSTADPGGGVLTDSTERPTVERWAERHEKDFSRACSALMAADSDSPGPATGDKGDGWLGTFGTALLLSVAGVLFTLGGQMSERVSAERRELRRRLGEDEAAFRTSARAYLAAYENNPGVDHTAVREAREALAATLVQVPGPAARRRAARRVADELPLARPLPSARGGTVLGKDARAGEARGAGEAVDGVPGSVSELDRPPGYWSVRTVRERYARGTTTGAGA